VIPPKGPAGERLSAISPDVGIEIILDTSGSMLQRTGGQSRIDLAKSVLRDIVRERLPLGAPVALRVLGSAGDPCGTRLAIPLGPLDPDRVIRLVDGVAVEQAADTPLGAAVRSVPEDLEGSPGTKIVVLITDSEERWPHPDLCGVDPGKAIADLRRHGIDARVNIVGLAVKDKRAKNQMRTWAHAGNGGYFDAKGGPELARAIERAVSAPFRVYDAAGNEVAGGTVGGDSVPLPPGTYSVVVLADPPARFDDVRIEPGRPVRLTLPVPEERVPSEGTVPQPAPEP
jgi:Ca-activated chloride channel family protein